MQITTAKKSISSAALIRLINDCRQRQAHASGVSFPSQTFPCVDQADITKKAQELLGVTPKASSHMFSQRQAHSLSSSYGPAVQTALVDFFEQQAAAPKVVAESKLTVSNATIIGSSANGPVRKAKIELPVGGGDSVSMSSLEVSELTGKRHDNVKRTIETLAESGVISLPQIEEVKVQRKRREESVEAYVFSGDKGRRDSIIVVAQLCPEFTATIVDRWQELETLYQQQAQATTPYGQMPVPMSQMFAMFSEQYGKLEQELQRQAQKIDSLSAAMQLLQRPAPKPRTKDPARIPGPQDWQVAKTMDSIRMSFSIAPHEIGLERFYLYLHSLDSDVARREALRQALHFGIALDASLPANFPANAKTITFKFTLSEKDTGLNDVLNMLLALPDDKQRRTAIKRHLVAKSQAVNVSVSLVQQPALF